MKQKQTLNKIRISEIRELVKYTSKIYPSIILEGNIYLDSNRIILFQNLNNDLSQIEKCLNCDLKEKILKKFGKQIRYSVSQAEEAITHGIKNSHERKQIPELRSKLNYLKSNLN